MKLLVIAYEFPPVLSGQSIRWFHLANAIADLGAEVHLLVPGFPDRHGFSGRPHERVIVHRCWPGPFIGLAGRLAEVVHGGAKTSRSTGGDGNGGFTCKSPSRLEFAYRIARAILDHVLFPDVRTEWFPVACSALERLMRVHTFDVMVSSHEPGVTLLLGLAAQRRWRVPWLVDMGDPVLGPRTPRWRRRLDRAFERLVCARADGIIVTCPELIDVLAERHAERIPQARLRRKTAVVRQGFVPPYPGSHTTHPPCSIPGTESDARFTLLFTGTLYGSFRSGQGLVQALAQLPQPDLRLVAAGNTGPLNSDPGVPANRLCVLGMIDHLECLALQRRATVLVNVGNEQADQVPGKLFEYFGAQRPILHLSSASDDPAATLLRNLNRGLVARNEPHSIRAALADLYESWRTGALDARFDLSLNSVQEYAWPVLAGHFLKQCEMLKHKLRSHS